MATLAALAQNSTPSAAHFLKSHQLLVQKFAADRNRQRMTPVPFSKSNRLVPFDAGDEGPWPCTGGGRASRVCTRDRVAGAGYACSQISTPSAAHFLKSHQLLVQKFAADRDRQKSSFNRTAIYEALQAPEGTPVCSITPVSRAPSQPEQCLCASLSWRAA